MATNLLAMPLATVTVETGNNEDWIDTILYLVDPGGGGEPIDQLDLTGIEFTMEVRRRAEDHEVIMSASTDDGRLAVGIQPDNGYFLIHVPLSEMKTKVAGTYVADVVGYADSNVRRVIIMSLIIIDGVTRGPEVTD